MNEIIKAAKGAGGTGRAYSRMKAKQTDAIAWAALAAKLPRFTVPVHIAFRFVEKDRRRDPDNVAAGARKMILDGLVLAGVLKGDGWAHVAGWTDTFEVGDQPGVSVTISAATASKSTP